MKSFVLITGEILTRVHIHQQGLQVMLQVMRSVERIPEKITSEMLATRIPVYEPQQQVIRTEKEQDTHILIRHIP